MTTCFVQLCDSLSAVVSVSITTRFIGFKSAAIDGVVTHYERGNKGFRLYMLEDYTEELAARHGLHDYDLPFTLDFLTQRMAGMEASLAR